MLRQARYLFFAMIVAVALCNLSVAQTIFEAEDAEVSVPGPALTTDIEGFSGTGSMVYNSEGGSGLTWLVDVAVAGDYPVSFRYQSPWGDKWNNLLVNGTWMPDWATGENWHIKFPQTVDDWEILQYGTVPLIKGENIIEVNHDWGWIYLDYMAIEGLGNQARNPSPSNHAVVSLDLTQLCWINPDPNSEDGIITSDVYFGTGEPNELVSGFGYKLIAEGTDLTCIEIPDPLDQFQTYYWLVNCHDSSGESGSILLGVIWDFNTNNDAPAVDAGPSQYLWLNNAGDPESAEVIFDAEVTDDGLPADELSYSWTLVSGPTEIIDPNGVVLTELPYGSKTADTEDITLKLTAVGTYLFQLTASDTDIETSDPVQVVVADTPCAAAQAMPGYNPIPGDINSDCHVNLADLAEITAHWLECNSLIPCEQ